MKQHKQYKTPFEYIEGIYLNKYNYTIEDLSDLLGFKEQYIQVNFMNQLDTLYIDNSNKILIKQILFDYINEPYLIPREHLEATKKLYRKKDILKKRVLIKEDSVYRLILNTFKKEILLTPEEKILVDLNKTDLDLILKHKLLSTRAIKQCYDFKYDTQLYRFLSGTRHIKYVINNESNRNNTARYLFY